MTALQNKIDFVGFITVDRANPNGDPLSGNQPRTDYDNYGEISDVCLKRKIRNRLQDMGEKIFVQSSDRTDDGCDSLKTRCEKVLGKDPQKKMGRKDFEQAACKTWLDVRAFGQLFAFKKGKGSDDEGNTDGVSIGVRGPVSVHTAVSVDPINAFSMQITKSVNGEPTKDGKKSSDTMGMKHRVDFGVYKMQGSINVQLAEKTGLSEEDAEHIKNALVTLFENDVSSARPEGSVEMTEFYWIVHPNKSGKVSSAKIHRSVKAKKKDGVSRARELADYEFDDNELKSVDGLKIEHYREGELVS